jgi:hypothetical protein
MANENLEKSSPPKSVVARFQKFFNEFKGETDRAAVILGAANLDSLFFHILKKLFVPVTGNVDDLLEGEAALSSFSSKIHLVYRLGLIDNHLSRALHLIRKIRNAFAHEVSSATLEEGSHGDRVRELENLLESHEKFDEFQEAFFPEKDKYGSVGLKFRAILVLLVLRLERLLQETKEIKLREPSPLIPKHLLKTSKME